MPQTLSQTPVTPPSATSATFDPEGITEQTAPYFRADPSPLSLLHPDLAFGTARLYADAGFTPAEVLELPGDQAFNAEVALVMATLEASGP
jgi:hypothetical protein